MRAGSRPISAGTTWSVEIGRDRQLATVERRVADAVQPRVGLDLQRDEIASGTADDDAGRR